MLKKNKLFLLLLILSSCATTSHKFMRGSVVMKISPSTAHICLVDNDVKKGSEVLFYHYDCDDNDSQKVGVAALCVVKKLGTGEVTKLLGAHYSVVETRSSFDFVEGTLVKVIEP